MQGYRYFPTEHFSARLKRIHKADPHGHERIWKVIRRLLENPSDADGTMHGQHHGRLKKYVGRRDYRLIYHWCELCRKEGRRLEDRCAHCDQLEDHSVIFFDVYHKNQVGRL